MDNVLIEETKLCLLKFHKYICENEVTAPSLELVLSLPTPLEIDAMLFGWLSAKGLWNNGIVTTKLFNLARKELLQ